MGIKNEEEEVEAQEESVEEEESEQSEESNEPEEPAFNDVEDYAAGSALDESEEYAGDKPVDIFSEEGQALFSELGLGKEEPTKFTREQIKSWPPEIRQVYQQMQQGVQKRFREQSELKKSLKDRLATLDSRKIEVDSSARDQFKVFDDERLAGYLKKPEGDKPEAWDVDARVKWEVQNALSTMLGGYHDTMKSIGGEHREHVEKQQAVARLEERKKELRSFISENKDFSEYQNGIIEFRKEHPTFTPEKAYDFLKGQKRQESSNNQVEAALDASAGRTHRAGRSGGRATADSPPSGLSGSEIARWFQENPSAHQKHLGKLRRA